MKLSSWTMGMETDGGTPALSLRVAGLHRDAPQRDDHLNPEPDHDHDHEG